MVPCHKFTYLCIKYKSSILHLKRQFKDAINELSIKDSYRFPYQHLHLTRFVILHILILFTNDRLLSNLQRLISANKSVQCMQKYSRVCIAREFRRYFSHAHNTLYLHRKWRLAGFRTRHHNGFSSYSSVIHVICQYSR